MLMWKIIERSTKTQRFRFYIYIYIYIVQHRDTQIHLGLEF